MNSYFLLTKLKGDVFFANSSRVMLGRDAGIAKNGLEVARYSACATPARWICRCRVKDGKVRCSIVDGEGLCIF
jgi:hypothetical protein